MVQTGSNHRFKPFFTQNPIGRFEPWFEPNLRLATFWFELEPPHGTLVGLFLIGSEHIDHRSSAIAVLVIQYTDSRSLASEIAPMRAPAKSKSPNNANAKSMRSQRPPRVGPTFGNPATVLYHLMGQYHHLGQRHFSLPF
jgi:hypothetical protein